MVSSPQYGYVQPVQPQYTYLQSAPQTNQQSHPPQVFLASSSAVPTQNWYPDSDASHHVTNMSQNIQQVTPFEGPDQITIGND